MSKEESGNDSFSLQLDLHKSEGTESAENFVSERYSNVIVVGGHDGQGYNYLDEQVIGHSDNSHITINSDKIHCRRGGLDLCNMDCSRGTVQQIKEIIDYSKDNGHERAKATVKPGEDQDWLRAVGYFTTNLEDEGLMPWEITVKYKDGRRETYENYGRVWDDIDDGGDVSAITMTLEPGTYE